MRKMIVLGTVALLTVLALAAAAMPLGQGIAQDQAGPGERNIEVQGAAATFGGALQEPAGTSSTGSITVGGAQATWGGALGKP